MRTDYKLHVKHSISYEESIALYHIQCLPLNRITLDQHKSDNNNRMIQFTKVCCGLNRFNGNHNI